MENLKKYFKQNEWGMIEHILFEGKGETSWNTLATQFQIRTEGSSEQRRKAANDIWRKFIRIVTTNNLDLTTVKQTLNGRGEVLFETRKLVPSQEQISTEGMTISKVTKGPYGDYISYIKTQEVEKEETILNVVQRLIDKHIEPNFEIKEVEPSDTFFNEDSGSRLAIVNMYDAHLDKIPIKSTCGVESTVEQNISIFLNTVDKICKQIAYNDVDEIIFPVGNDLFHTNGFNSQTKKGTQIEYYGSPEDNYYAICDAITEAITKLAVVSKNGVKVIMVKGNHDEDKITVLGYWLERLFKGTNVEVDFLRKQRKYIKFGQNLIGFAHGDKEKSKIAQLPLLMATEAKEMWGTTTHRKMYLGDLHHGFEYQFLKAKDMPGVEIEYLRSVGTTDSWHEDFGWIGIPKTAYLQIFDSEDGELVRQKFNIK